MRWTQPQHKPRQPEKATKTIASGRQTFCSKRRYESAGALLLFRTLGISGTFADKNAEEIQIFYVAGCNQQPGTNGPTRCREYITSWLAREPGVVTRTVMSGSQPLRVQKISE